MVRLVLRFRVAFFFCSVHTKQFHFTIYITILYISTLALALGPFEINTKTMLTCYSHSQQTFRPCLQGCNTTTDPGAMAPIRLLVKTNSEFWAGELYTLWIQVPDWRKIRLCVSMWTEQCATMRSIQSAPPLCNLLTHSPMINATITTTMVNANTADCARG